MLNKKEAYLCLSSVVRAREPRLLNAERAERMLDASSFEEAAKLLSDCGYEDMSQMGLKEIEASLNMHRDSIFKEIEHLIPDRIIVDFFRMKYDYHNAKVLVKSEAMNMDASRLLSSSGRIPGDKLKTMFHEERFSEMPAKLREAINQAKSVLARTSNPQLSDFVFDKAYFSELNDIAANSENSFLKGYTSILIDTANLKSAVRTMRMGKNADFLHEALIPGGNTDPVRILAASDKDTLLGLYSHTRLEKAAAAAADAIDGGSQTEFELACDNAVNAFLKSAKLISFGAEPVAAYLAAVENEITAVRMILTGRLAGVKSETIKERLRDMYA